MANIDIQIEQIINKTVKATLKQVRKPATNAFRQTEARLYAYPILLKNIERYKLDIADLKAERITSRSKDITCCPSANTGIRLTPEERQAGKVAAVQLRMDRDLEEIKEIECGLNEIKPDGYYFIISQRYFDNRSDEDIAAVQSCDKATIWRNRNRLVKKLSIIYYGADAIEIEG